MENPYNEGRPGSLADRAYRQTSAVGMGTAVVWVVTWAWLGMLSLAAVGLFSLAGMAAARAYRQRLGYPAATRISVVFCYLAIVAAILRTGGMSGPFASTLLILPLGPAIALGAAECIRWGGIVLVTGGGLWIREVAVGPFADLAPAGSAAPLRGIAQLSVLVATLLCLYTYGRINEQARMRLRRSRAQLEQAHRELQLSHQKLVVSEKMAALGRLSAGMAHEINSTLAGAINSVELARGDAESLESALERDGFTSPEVPELAEEMRDSLHLASTALDKIAAFVRRMRGQTSMAHEGTDQTFCAADEARTVLRLLQVTLVEKRVTLEAEIGAGVWLRGDPARFGQIVQNLVTNAVDAYEGEPGSVRVRIAPEEDRVVVEVEDRGSGIPEPIRDRIFDHFFTTKGVGEGTGLGLALVHDLATKYFGGSIEFDTEVGRGTRFTVRLPAAKEEP